MFGGVARFTGSSRTAGAEFRIAIAGPLVTLLITPPASAPGPRSTATLLGRCELRRERHISTGVAVLAWLANINAAILIFNLLPAFPLDGGRMARASVWKVTGNRERATIFAARLGQGFAYAFIAIGILIADRRLAVRGRLAGADRLDARRLRPRNGRAAAS